MPTDEYYEMKELAKQKAREDDQSARDRSAKLSPYVEEETLRILRKVGDTSGVGALGLGVLALAGAPVAGPAALAAGATSAAMYVAEGLTDARQGRQKEGAAKIALGLLEAATTKKMSAAVPKPVLSKSSVGRAAGKLKPYASGVGALGLDAGINVAQDALRDYANDTRPTDAALADELESLSKDPVQLRLLKQQRSSSRNLL